MGHFAWAFNNKLAVLLQSRALIAQLATETLEDVHKKEEWERDFERDVERFRTVADIWVSTYFGNQVAWEAYNALLENLQSPEAEWQKLLQKKCIKKAQDLHDEKRFFHWELEFPEVFYDENGNRKANPGFDAVVGNPPYDVLEKERLGAENPHMELANYLESNPAYYPALGGKVNLFRPFLIQEILLLRNGALLGKIVPLALVNDFSCTRIRTYLLKNLNVSHIECFPQKDDPKDRVFSDAKLSTCVLVIIKPGPTKEFLIRIHPGKYFISNPKQVFASFDEIYAVDPEALPIPLVTQKEWNLAVKVHSCLPTCQLTDLVNLTRGEINQTIFSEFITENPSHHEMIKGVEIDRFAEHWYLSQGEKQWFDENLYFRKTESHKEAPTFRIGIQRITGIDDKTRLIATFFDRRVYFADSTNSIISDDRTKLHFVLALINSRFFNWRFKLTSTNNNVATNELNRLPIRRINFTTPKEKREQLLKQGKKLYQDYLGSQNWDKVLAFIAQRLPQKPGGTPDTEQEQSDVVHDLLALLAEEMTRLNKEKQSLIKGFLGWLEKEILKGSVEDQKNKTKIRNFHEGTFEHLLDVLKKNKVVPDPAPQIFRDTIESEFSHTMNVLVPLKSRIKATDDLINRIVYRLYGLTDAEIAVVAGQDFHT